MATFGEKAVGLDFNPSSLPEVDRAKRLCAELIDMCHTARQQFDGKAPSLHKDLYDTAIANLIMAQMSVVKAQTFRDD